MNDVSVLLSLVSIYRSFLPSSWRVRGFGWAVDLVRDLKKGIFEARRSGITVSSIDMRKSASHARLEID